MRTARATAVAGVASLALLAFGATARADVFGSISLVSAGAVAGTPHSEQADDAAHAAISGDGRYVAFDGSVGGKRGVFRRDLVSGDIAAVAAGDAVQPSISEDGRYVSFTTTARLDEQNDVNAAPDVYVRDMSKPDSNPCPVGWELTAASQESCAFTLASAVSGGSQGLTYSYGSNQAFEETHLGAVASGRSALSASGRTVAFVTTAVSDAANPGRAAPSGLSEAAETPPLQVLVRNLDSRVTELVSVRRDAGSGGALLDASGQPEPIPLGGSFGAVYVGGPFPGALAFPAPWTGASISADGSTVAWMGTQIGEQAPALGEDLARQPGYTEPLWRRIGAGQAAPIRRVTGGPDPANPACAASGEEKPASPATLADPCQGPFDTTGGIGGVTGLWTLGAEYDYLPRLSADGTTVAFIATAREVASGEELKVGETSDDLYIVDMRDGLTRVQSVRRLTELAGGGTSDLARNAPIVDLGVSPDGSEIAFTTKRTVFPLGSPSYVSGAGGVGIVELYDVDLANDTLTRVTRGFAGEPSEAPHEAPGTTISPSLSNDGNELAFSSEADNLVYGDGNHASDAFVVPRMRFQATPTPQLISPPPPGPSLGSAWSLGVTALSRRDGTVVLEARVPGAGTLRAGAQSAVRVRLVGRPRKVHGKRRARTTVQTRTVATRSGRPSAYGLTTLTLKLGRSYSSLASARGGLSSTVNVTFSATGHKTLRQSVPVAFVRVVHAKSHKRRRR
ncbi:MAG: hypothetical protein ACYDHT_08915 [Solirubrobacteraceae bacterium]